MNRIRDLYHWKADVRGNLADKNEAAKIAYYERANMCGVLKDTHEYTKRVLSGIEAKNWIFNGGKAAA